MAAGWVQASGRDTVFIGGMDESPAIAAAARLARDCPSFALDDEDEIYLPGETTCFNCRFRRWIPAGFTCMRGLLVPD